MNEGRGIFLVKTDVVDLVDHYDTVIHVVNASRFEDMLLSLKYAANQLPKGPSPIIQTKIKRINRELALFKTNRSKRGLFNFIGSGIKFITGNLDDKDLEDVKNRINTLEENEENMVDYSNKLNKYNTHVNDELKIMTEHINNETDQLYRITSNFSRSVADIQYQFRLKLAEDNINQHLDILLNHIHDVKQSISFAKTGILSANLMEAEELGNLSLIQYENIKTAILHRNENNFLYFVIQIPIMNTNKCYRLLAIPIPNYETKHQVVLKQKQQKYVVCDSIIYITKGNEVRNMEKPEEPCLQNLYFQRTAQCTFENNTQASIKQITDNIIITTNIGKTLLKHDCKEGGTTTLKGNNIIKFINCTVEMLGTIYQSKTREVLEHTIIPNLHGYVSASFQPTLSLETLHHRDLEHGKELTLIHYKIRTGSFIGATGITILIIIGIALTTITITKHRHRILNFRIRQGSNLEGGRVTATANATALDDLPQTFSTLPRAFANNPFASSTVHFQFPETNNQQSTPI